jgi:hypothetical protein
LSLASQTWIIFCRVVDHFGDAGFCWRLAVALKRLGIGNIVLVIDQLPVLEKLRGEESLSGVSLLSWSSTEERWNKSGVPSSESADVVIEAFACELPEAYVRSLGLDCQWITLDYLATEPWADQVHGKPSPLPRGSHAAALKRRWFIPGFSAATGGLLHGSWRHLSTQERRSCRHKLTGESIGDDVFLILAFGYPDADWKFFLNQRLLLPKGFRSVRLWRPQGLELSQTEFDCALQACDLNFVRGEDSFVRAHWAAAGSWKVPFVWQPYRQLDQAHRHKLAGWAGQILSAPQLSVLRDLQWTWNRLGPSGQELESRSGPDLDRDWSTFCQHYRQVQSRLHRSCLNLARQQGLEANLIRFIR